MRRALPQPRPTANIHLPPACNYERRSLVAALRRLHENRTPDLYEGVMPSKGLEAARLVNPLHFFRSYKQALHGFSRGSVAWSETKWALPHYEKELTARMSR